MITVDRKQFARAIKLASAVVEKRSTIPALTGVKLTANGSLAIEGTDLDNDMRVEMPYEGEAGELFLANPRDVASAINAAGGEQVELSDGSDEKKNRTKVKVGKLDAELIGQHPDDHPGAERIVEEIFGTTIGEAELAQIRRVMAAISTEKTRYYLNGVNVKKLADWTYRFCATDGYRLMIVDVPLPDAKGDLPEQFIIPRRFLQVVLNAYGKPKDGLSFKVGYSAKSNKRDKSLVNSTRAPRVLVAGEVSGNRLDVTGKIIDGTFPDVGRVIPGEQKHFARFKIAELAKAIQALTPLSTERTRAIRMTFPKGKVRCELHSPDRGESGFNFPAEHDLPKDFMIGMNARYLLDFAKSLTGEEMQLGIDDPGAPVKVTDPADTAFLGVQMPIRV